MLHKHYNLSWRLARLCIGRVQLTPVRKQHAKYPCVILQCAPPSKFASLALWGQTSNTNLFSQPCSGIAHRRESTQQHRKQSASFHAWSLHIRTFATVIESRIHASRLPTSPTSSPAERTNLFSIGAGRTKADRSSHRHTLIGASEPARVSSTWLAAHNHDRAHRTQRQ